MQKMLVCNMVKQKAEKKEPSPRAGVHVRFHRQWAPLRHHLQLDPHEEAPALRKCQDTKIELRLEVTRAPPRKDICGADVQLREKLIVCERERESSCKLFSQCLVLE